MLAAVMPGRQRGAVHNKYDLRSIGNSTLVNLCFKISLFLFFLDLR